MAASDQTAYRSSGEQTAHYTNRPSLYLDISLGQGDIQFVSNHFTAHARTAYEDYDNPEMKRHLLRLWLSAA